MAVEKDDGIEGLVLRGSRSLPLNSQVAEKVLEISSLKFTRLLFADKSPETTKPDEIGLLRAERSVSEPLGPRASFPENPPFFINGRRLGNQRCLTF